VATSITFTGNVSVDFPTGPGVFIATDSRTGACRGLFKIDWHEHDDHPTEGITGPHSYLKFVKRKFVHPDHADELTVPKPVIAFADVFFPHGSDPFDATSPIVSDPTGWNIYDIRFAYDAASDTAFFGEARDSST
jgi:hypothetical protein